DAEENSHDGFSRGHQSEGMRTAQVERRNHRMPLWKRARRIFLLAAAVCLIAAATSYLPAITAKHNVGLGVTSVEWLRQNGGNSIVSELENWYYSLEAPEKGGPALTSLPKVGLVSGRLGAKADAYRPPNIPALIHPALPGEGVWKKAAAGA